MMENNKRAARDPDYYFYDGTAFLVGGILFKVSGPGSNLTHSQG
jgi:hypothetical protein